MLELLLTLLLLGGPGAPEPHTITFDEVPCAPQWGCVTHYNVYEKLDLHGSWWLNTSCPGSPCSVMLRRPTPGNVLYLSLTSVADTGLESSH